MGHIYTNRPSLGNPVKQSGEENPARWQVRVLRWREKLFELLEQLSVASEVTVRVLPLHFFEYGACVIKSVGIRLPLGG